MPRNIEIKARLPDFSHTRALALKLASLPEQLLVQEDVFFHVPHGRLKLRIFSSNRGELIFYHRADQAGPKLSQYTIAPVQNVESIRSTLSEALGVRGVVKKTRHLILVGQTRVHLDRVDGLGDFLELEVVMRDGQSADDGAAIMGDLIQSLGVVEGDLIADAYIDLIDARDRQERQVRQGRQEKGG